jgi:hypothetical protein
VTLRKRDRPPDRGWAAAPNPFPWLFNGGLGDVHSLHGVIYEPYVKDGVLQFVVGSINTSFPTKQLV